MKKKLVKLGISFLAVLALVPSTMGFSLFGSNNNSDVTAVHAAEQRIVLGTSTLSKAQTKTLADNMKKLKNQSSLKTLIVGIVSRYGGVVGWASTIAAQLSANATYKQIVIDAAKQGKRVKITVTDNKNYHTSYSTQIKYTIVK